MPRAIFLYCRVCWNIQGPGRHFQEARMGSTLICIFAAQNIPTQVNFLQGACPIPTFQFNYPSCWGAEVLAARSTFIFLNPSQLDLPSRSPAGLKTSPKSPKLPSPRDACSGSCSNPAPWALQLLPQRDLLPAPALQCHPPAGYGRAAGAKSDPDLEFSPRPKLRSHRLWDEEPRAKLSPDSWSTALSHKDGITTRPSGSLNFLPETLSGKSGQLSCLRTHHL